MNLYIHMDMNVQGARTKAGVSNEEFDLSFGCIDTIIQGRRMLFLSLVRQQLFVLESGRNVT